MRWDAIPWERTIEADGLDGFKAQPFCVIQVQVDESITVGYKVDLG
jgi:hypothetical protein